MVHAESTRADVPHFMLSGEFRACEDLLKGIPHSQAVFEKGQRLWSIGEFIERVYYIESGLVQVVALHESGHRRMVWLVGSGTVYPGCHNARFKIEESIEAYAVTRVNALEFSRQTFHEALIRNPDLASAEIEFYARMINTGLYDSAHQRFNDSFTSLCNLIYLLSLGNGESNLRIGLSQDEFASLLGIERANVARILSRLAKEGVIQTHRGWIEVLSPEKLMEHCSSESVSS